MSRKQTGKIKIGIVGMGRAGGGMHCPELEKKLDKFDIAAVCDISKEQCLPYAKKFGSRIYLKMEELLRDKEIELVSIATRSMDHLAHAKMALKSGKDVFLEKPITIDYKEALELKKAAGKAKGKLFLRHNRRFEPAFQHIREIIASGILGKVFEIKLRRLSYQRRCDWQTLKEFGGGQLNNWGPHIIDHSLCFLESDVHDMWSDTKRVAAAGDAEDHLKIVFRGKNGRIVDMEISGGVAIREPEYIVSGSKGGLSCTGDTISLRYLDPKVKLRPVKALRGNPKGFCTEELTWIEKTVKVAPELKVDTDSIWDYLYDSIRKGKKFPITLDHGVEIMRIVSEVRNNSSL